MKKGAMKTMDGNTAAGHVGHACSEVIAIYPITPSSVMGEEADAKSAAGEKNIWGTIPDVIELQSEAGAAAAVHGALISGSIATTFTASQGLLLMIPTMFKIAGELMPTVFHIAARSIACQALSIFGDHSDVMATRSTGFGMLASGSVQESMDFALVATAATLESRIPMLHFFDGFRTSHEVNKIFVLSQDDMRSVIDEQFIYAHRQRALSPDHPMISGTSQNPDVYFQGRETVNLFYQKCPEIVEKYMKKLQAVTGREYGLFQYYGHPKAERIIIIMGSGAETVHETVDELVEKGQKVGLIKVRLYRPFSIDRFLAALPASVQKIAVMDRTKEPGSEGEPLYLDVVNSIFDSVSCGKASFAKMPKIVGGRYGLSCKEFTPGMVQAIFKNLEQPDPKNHFTIGIHDDVTHTSLEWDPCVSSTSGKSFQAMFYGLGSDGTVSANKNSIKIIGEATDMYSQGYFVYDSKKAGALTVSHLRFGKNPIRSAYLCNEADFLACHNFTFLEKYNMLSNLKKGGTFLLNSPYTASEVWDKVPFEVQKQITEKNAKFYVIDANRLAKDLGLGVRINTIMQTAFFKISGVLPESEAIELIRDSIKKTYGNKGPKVVEMNMKAIDGALDEIHPVKYPNASSTFRLPPTVPDHAPDFVKNVLAKIMQFRGDEIKVSEWPADGRVISATTQYEKRNIALEIPVWNPQNCIQCGFCSLVCPHAAIRMKAYDPSALKGAPGTFKSVDARKPLDQMKFTVQIAPEDCTGCGVCQQVCPAKGKALVMTPQLPLRRTEAENFAFFLDLPEVDPSLIKKDTVKGSQFIRPLFEYSGACAGCGETPYVKLLSQLFGHRAIIANATGCSSIYGGNLPTTPYCKRKDGIGPAWTNSLFEDAAEVGMGFRLTVDYKKNEARNRLIASDIPGEIKQAILDADQSSDVGIEAQRKRISELKMMVANKDPYFATIVDYLVDKSIWSIGGDGWAYDIGYGGLDHVLASGRNVNLLVLDTEVYSNTGGQCSKSTPRGATAKFAVAGKSMPKKDLGMLAMTYGNIYVAKIAMGANPAQTVKAFVEAESYPGSSIVIAYSPCIAHGIDMSKQLDTQKQAVDSGHWVLYRFDPRRIANRQNPLQLDSKPPTMEMQNYMYNQIRYRALKMAQPERALELLDLAQKDVTLRFKIYEQLAQMNYTTEEK